jgi:hypothetical protein
VVLKFWCKIPRPSSSGFFFTDGQKTGYQNNGLHKSPIISAPHPIRSRITIKGLHFKSSGNTPNFNSTKQRQPPAVVFYSNQQQINATSQQSSSTQLNQQPPSSSFIAHRRNVNIFNEVLVQCRRASGRVSFISHLILH